MPRHRRRLADDLFDLAARLPWWASLLSAVAAYGVLRPIATLVLSTPQGAVDVAVTALAQLIVLLAQVGQYLIPLGLLAAAALSAFLRWKSLDLLGPDRPHQDRRRFSATLRRASASIQRQTDRLRAHWGRTSSLRDSSLGRSFARGAVALDGGVSMEPSDGTELEIGRELTALIRSEQEAADRIPRIVGPGDAGRAAPKKRTRRIKIGRPSNRKILDFMGILLASAGIWTGYQWFDALPAESDSSPWALLGRGYAEPNESPLGSGGTGSSGKPEPTQTPLGQFNFGGNWERTASTPDELPLPEEPQLVEQYRSVKELEAAFNVKYLPPADCYNWQTNDQMVRCGNHRMRTRRAFIESGGKITPEMLGATGAPRGYPAPTLSPAPIMDWRTEQALREESEQLWPSEGEQDSDFETDWDQNAGEMPATSPAAEYSWGTGMIQEPAAEQAQDWRRVEDPRVEDTRRLQDWSEPQELGREPDWRQPQDWSRQQSRGYPQDSTPQQNWRRQQDWRQPQDLTQQRGWIQQQDQFPQAGPDAAGSWR